MTEPTPGDADDREISDVGLPRPSDGDRTDGTAAAVGGRDEDVDGGPVAEEEALDEVFPPADGRA